MAGIRDIAQLAGVSIGTVDRVLHNRGRCADSTRKKVLDAAAKLNYQPNLTARGLRRNKPCRLAVVQALPEQDQGFWASADEGVTQAKNEFKQFNVDIELIPFDRYDTDSFREACAKAREGCHGVLLAPLLPSESLAFVEANPELPIVAFDCPLEHEGLVQSLHQPGNVGGRTVAGLFRFHHSSTDRLAVVGYESHNINIAQRMKGFVDGLVEAGYPEPDKLVVPDELDLFELQRHLTDNEIDLAQYQGVFVAKTGTHKYARLLNREGRKTFLVGYDLVPENLRELRNGTIDALISQNSARQAYEGVKTLVNRVLYNIPPKQELVLMPADIVTRENIDSYLDFHGR